MRERVDADTEALTRISMWGVPVFVFAGQALWGQDRIEDLEVLLGDAGLARESARTSAAQRS